MNEFVHTSISWIRAYIKALRVFSLTLALGATSSGIIAAWLDGSMEANTTLENIILIIGITIAGLAVQAGANLINDYFEGSFKYPDPSQKQLRFLGRQRTVFDVFVFLTGIAALGLSALIGLYLVYVSDWIMLVIGIIGVIGSYAYTGEPFVYKRKGLGVFLSWLLMGPLMCLGAYYPFAAQLSWYPIVLGLPISLLVPALMISNEMRDFKRDKKISMGTLSTKLGPRLSLRLYELLVFGSLFLTLVFVISSIYPLYGLAIVFVLPLSLKARKCVANFEGLSIPRTNRVHLFTMIILVGSLILSGV
jgi:1,4-dihydroxy-2-naphthoate octaprenyltransferase